MDKKSEQLLRKLKFIAEAKKNNYPNAGSFARKMQQFESENGQPFGCSARTIARDIRDLIEFHKAPLEYDACQRGYYLRNPDWEFSCPVLLSSKFLFFQEDFSKTCYASYWLQITFSFFRKYQTKSKFFASDLIRQSNNPS